MVLAQTQTQTTDGSQTCTVFTHIYAVNSTSIPQWYRKTPETKKESETLKDLARKQILTALEAGPKRIRPKTREELRWRLEDLREELAKLKVDVERQKAQRPVVTQPKAGEKENLAEEISAQKTAIQEWKKRVAGLEQEGAGLQVAIASAEQVLQRGRERLDAACSPSWAEKYGNGLGGVAMTLPASLSP
ncbi:unnamed protein product [Symbiodinium sp. CCMP2456]|nr:unnamed protein product [Symbiodinium sp. CCMP2456]